VLLAGRAKEQDSLFDPKTFGILKGLLTNTHNPRRATKKTSDTRRALK
jgi:hypothetical protein